MKAVILAGGEGTRLRPLTLRLPKPVVPVVDRPFLEHQLDMLARVGVDEVIFSVAYRPERIQAVFGDGRPGLPIRYLFESSPLGTGGAVKNAEAWLDSTTLVLNGDILTDLDLHELVERHRRTQAAATLFLTPVENPAAYGLVETDADGRVRRFVEKPGAEELAQRRCNTINAGIYVLERDTLALMPAGVNYSIERGFFPALLEGGRRVSAHIHGGYWIDIGTPEKYLQVHRDVLHARLPVALRGLPRGGGWVHESARVDPQARLEPPFYLGPGCRVEAEAQVGPDTTLGAGVWLEAGARVSSSVLWSGVRVGPGALVDGAILGEQAHVGANSRVGRGTVLGENTRLSDHSRTS